MANSPSNLPVQFVYFDIGQVLVSMEQGFWEFCQEHNFSQGEMERFDATWSKYSNDLCKGTITNEWFRSKFKEEAGIELAQWFDIRKMTVDRFQPIPQMHQLLTQVAHKYPIGLLSNAYQGMIDGLRQQGKLPSAEYQVIVDSFEVKMIKPEPAIYELATKKAGVATQQIFFIDDNRKNIDAAGKFGWQTYQFSENQIEKSVKELSGLLL